MLANYTTNPISRVDKTRTCNITASQIQGANQLPYYSIFAESIVLETNAFYSTHYLAGKSTTLVVYSPLTLCIIHNDIYPSLYNLSMGNAYLLNHYDKGILHYSFHTSSRWNLLPYHWDLLSNLLFLISVPCGGMRSRPPNTINVQSVFKTVPSPTELLLHWQDVGELNPNLLSDSQAH